MLRKTVVATGLALFCLSSLTSGDILKVVDEPTQLTLPGRYFMHPVWSPRGDRLALTGRNYEGLWIMNPQGGEPQQICDQLGAGFGPTWSPDGQRIACRVNVVHNKRQLSASAVYDLDKGTATELTEYEKNLGLPRWIDRGRKLSFPKDHKLDVVEAPGASSSASSMEETILYLRKGAMVLREWPQDTEKVLQPVEGDILLAVLSPDKSHIAFEVSGAQLYVVNVDGAGLVELGRGERPRWSPDGEWLTYMVTEDDGQRILSSDIYAIKRDGTAKLAITQTIDRLEMNPDWSPDGRLIACDTRGEGIILLIPVQMDRDYPPER
jgi:Tol biopolymer transport system component